ncbi:MAG: hypothetical protein LBB25_02950 [Holosporaceae bacterium]|jgi:hypothetical protein|nr:hypothetical protein [Holosporaceae bacterium]
MVKCSVRAVVRNICYAGAAACLAVNMANDLNAVNNCRAEEVDTGDSCFGQFRPIVLDFLTMTSGICTYPRWSRALAHISNNVSLLRTNEYLHEIHYACGAVYSTCVCFDGISRLCLDYVEDLEFRNNLFALLSLVPNLLASCKARLRCQDVIEDFTGFLNMTMTKTPIISPNDEELFMRVQISLASEFKNP